MSKLYLDIETLPAPEDKHEAVKFLHKKALEKNKALGQDFEQYLLNTSFDGAFGRILCIGYATDDNPAEVLYSENDEKKMLEDFWQIAQDAFLFIGHNIIDFDMRFIYQRSVVNGVTPTKDLSFARYRRSPMFDTDREWMKWAMQKIGLEKLALALGIPSPKDGIDGSQVYSFYKAGKINDILEYCKRDVEVTRKIYKKISFT